MIYLHVADWVDDCIAVDKTGKEYIDLTSGGIFAGILGACNNRLANVPLEGNPIASYAPRYGNYTRDKYIELLKDFTGFNCVALFTAGTEATEAFWRLRRTQTGKPGIWGGTVDPDNVGKSIARPDAMHGRTVGAMIMAGKISTEPGVVGYGVDPSGSGLCFGGSYEITSGMIVEPYHAPSGQFHRQVTIDRLKQHQKTHKREIPLCIDEIQGGFGRTGQLFAHKWYSGLKPAFITIGKGMGGGYPISALLGPKWAMEEDKKLVEAADLHSTYSGWPMACSAGIAVIEEIKRMNLIAESYRKGQRMHEKLKSVSFSVHGKGLMAGIEFPDEKWATLAVERCQERGVLVVHTGRKWIKLGPALVIDPKLLDRAIDTVIDVCEEVRNEVEACRDTCEGSAAGKNEL